MKKIKLTKGKYAVVDDDMFEYLNQWKWCTTRSKNGKIFYANRNIWLKSGKQRTIRMHRVIMNTPKGMETDHISGDGLDNRRKNLRICTKSDNLRNQGKSSNNTSGYKGVSWYKRNKRWCARIWLNNKSIHLGYFTNKIEAVRVYDKAAKKYHGEFAKLNFK